MPDVVRYIDLKLAALGYPGSHHADSELLRSRARSCATFTRRI